MRVELDKISLVIEQTIEICADVSLADSIEYGYDADEALREAVLEGDYMEMDEPATYAMVEGVVSQARLDEVQRQAATNMMRAEAAEREAKYLIAELRRLGIERDEKGVFRSASKRGQAV